MNVGLVMGQVKGNTGAVLQGKGVPKRQQSFSGSSVFKELLTLLSGGKTANDSKTGIVSIPLQLKGANSLLERLTLLVRHVVDLDKLNQHPEAAELLRDTAFLLNALAAMIANTSGPPGGLKAAFPRLAAGTLQANSLLPEMFAGNEAILNNLFAGNAVKGDNPAGFETLAPALAQAVSSLGLTEQQSKEFYALIQQLQQGSVPEKQISGAVKTLVARANSRLKELKAQAKGEKPGPGQTGYPLKSGEKTRGEETAADRDTKFWLPLQEDNRDTKAAHNKLPHPSSQRQDGLLAYGGKGTARAAAPAGRADLSLLSQTSRQVPVGSREEIFQQLVQKLQAIRGAGKHELQVQLKPDYLGKLTLKVEQSDGGITAKIMVENQAVKEVIQQHLPHLKQVLQQQGIKVDQAAVFMQERHGQGSRFQFGGQQHFQQHEQGTYGPILDRFEEEEKSELTLYPKTNGLVDYLA